MKHYPNNLRCWPHSHALTISVLFAFPLFLSSRRRHNFFPQNFWGCSVTSWSPCREIHSMLVEKVDHVKRWMKLSIWPVSVDTWKEPYCFFCNQGFAACVNICLWQAGMPSVLLWFHSRVCWVRLHCLYRESILTQKGEGEGCRDVTIVPTHTLKNTTHL